MTLSRFSSPPQAIHPFSWFQAIDLSLVLFGIPIYEIMLVKAKPKAVI